MSKVCRRHKYGPRIWTFGSRMKIKRRDKVARSWWKSDSRVGALVKVIPREPSADAISIFGIQIRTFTSSLHLAYGRPAQAESHSCSGCLSQSGALLHRLRPHGELIQLWYNRTGQLDNWKCSKENPWKSHSGRLLGPFPTCNPAAWCQSCCSSFAEGFHRTVQILTIGSSNPSNPRSLCQSDCQKPNATGSKRHFQRWSTARHRTHLLNIEIARPGHPIFVETHGIETSPRWNAIETIHGILPKRSQDSKISGVHKGWSEKFQGFWLLSGVQELLPRQHRF